MVDAYKQQTQGIKCMGVEFEEVLYLAPKTNKIKRGDSLIPC
jgi:hypothetical protein